MANATGSCSFAAMTLFAFLLGVYNTVTPSWIWRFNDGEFFCPANYKDCGNNNFGSGIWAISYSSALATEVTDEGVCPFSYNDTRCEFETQTLYWSEFLDEPLRSEACVSDSPVYTKWAEPMNFCDRPDGVFVMPEEISVPRAFNIMSMITVITAVLFGCVSVKQSVFLSNVASGLAFFGCLFSIVSLSTYMDWQYPRSLIEGDGFFLPFRTTEQDKLIVVRVKMNVGPGVLAMALQIVFLTTATIGFRCIANIYKKENLEERQLEKALEDSKREKFENLEAQTQLEGVLNHNAREEMDEDAYEEEIEVDGSGNAIRKTGSTRHAWIMDTATGDMVSQKPSSRAILLDEAGNEREVQIINAATAADDDALEAEGDVALV